MTFNCVFYFLQYLRSDHIVCHRDLCEFIYSLCKSLCFSLRFQLPTCQVKPQLVKSMEFIRS